VSTSFLFPHLPHFLRGNRLPGKRPDLAEQAAPTNSGYSVYSVYRVETSKGFRHFWHLNSRAFLGFSTIGAFSQFCQFLPWGFQKNSLGFLPKFLTSIVLLPWLLPQASVRQGLFLPGCP
jgi:hypothetical protein